VVGLAFPEFFDQGVHRGEVDLEAIRAGLDGKGDRQVGLAHAGRPQEDDVLVLFDEFMSKSAMISFLFSWGWKLKSYSSMLLAVEVPRSSWRSGSGASL